MGGIVWEVVWVAVGLGGVPGVVPGISLGGVTSFVTGEPWKKGPLVGPGLYRGRNPTQLYRDYFINHDIRIPINQPGWLNGKDRRVGFFLTVARKPCFPKEALQHEWLTAMDPLKDPLSGDAGAALPSISEGLAFPSGTTWLLGYPGHQLIYLGG